MKTKKYSSQVFLVKFFDLNLLSFLLKIVTGIYFRNNTSLIKPVSIHQKTINLKIL